MANIVVYDVETLGVFDDSIILSMGAVAFDPEKEYTFADLIKPENSFFCKIDAASQKKMGRKSYASTINEFWKQQPLAVQQRSLLPSPQDISPGAAVEALRRWLKEKGATEKESTIFTRGSLDYSATQHLCQITLGVEVPVPYWTIRDVRTAVDLLSGSKNGYCRVSKDVSACIKHDPVHDCALDAMMLMYYIEE